MSRSSWMILVLGGVLTLGLALRTLGPSVVVPAQTPLVSPAHGGEATLVRAAAATVSVVSPTRDRPSENSPAEGSELTPEMRGALALGEESGEREAALAKALQAWAAEDVAAAAAWTKTQRVLPAAVAKAAVMNGAAQTSAEAATTYLARLDGEEPDNRLEHGSLFIHALGEIGEYSRAATWAMSAEVTEVDWITAAFDRWSTAQPERAMLAALAVENTERRRAATDAAIGAWARTDPIALAESATRFPSGPEKNLAIITALRAWAEIDPEKASAWMIAHREALVEVPNLAVVAED